MSDDFTAQVRPLVGGGWEWRILEWVDDPDAERYAVSSSPPFRRQETIREGMCDTEAIARDFAQAMLRKYELESPAGDWTAA